MTKETNQPTRVFDLFATEEPAFELRPFLFKYILQYWYLYVLLLGTGVGMAWIYLRYTPAQFEIKSSLLIKDDSESNSSGISEDALFKDLGILKGSKNLENEIQILKSETLMKAAVKKLGLEVEYHSLGRIHGDELYRQSPIKIDSFSNTGNGLPRLTIRYIDNTRFELVQGVNTVSHRFGEWIPAKGGGYRLKRDTLFPPSEGLLEIRFLKIENQGVRYAKRLAVKPLSSYSSVLELKLVDPVPAKGMDILNTLVEAYNEAAIDDKNKVSRRTINFIEDRLIYLTNELAGVEGSVQTYKQRNEIGLKVEKSIEMVMDELSVLDQTISVNEVQRSVLNSLAAYMRSGAGKDNLIPSNLSSADGTLSDLIAQYNEQLLNRERLQRTAKPDNPVLISMNQQIGALFENILETINRVDRRLEEKLQQTTEKRDLLTGKIRQAPRLERELQEIMRQQSIKQNLYLYLLQKREETSLSLATAVAFGAVVDSRRFSDTVEAEFGGGLSAGHERAPSVRVVNRPISIRWELGAVHTQAGRAGAGVEGRVPHLGGHDGSVTNRGCLVCGPMR